MAKYIEVEVPDEFSGDDLIVVRASTLSRPPYSVDRDQLGRLVNEFCRDIEAAFGNGEPGNGPWKCHIDETLMDWPDLMDTYNKARTALVDAGLTAEELENLYAPDGGHISDEHPQFRVEMWKADETRRGYWDWVAAQVAWHAND